MKNSSYNQTFTTICPSISVPCSGILTGWKVTLVNPATVNKTFLDIWRWSSSGRFELVGSTTIRDAHDDHAPFVFPGYLEFKLSKSERFFVKKGDLLGVRYHDDVHKATVAYLSNFNANLAGLPSGRCLIFVNKMTETINREVSWTKKVAVIESDFQMETRSYAVQAEINPPTIGENCDVDSDCPVNSRCFTLSCTKRFCICKPDYLPSKDGMFCRRIVDIGHRCSPSKTACIGEMDIPPSARCNSVTSRCECEQGYDVRAPENYKCRPKFIREESENQTYELPSSEFTTFGLLGDSCSQDINETSLAPCFSSAGLECREGQCKCRFGFRPKTDEERAVYPDSLSECMWSSESAVGCVTRKIVPVTHSTTPPPPPPTTTPPCYSTYTCWLLSQQRNNTNVDGFNNSSSTIEPPTNVTDVVPPESILRQLRIGERCWSDSRCPVNALCYPFTCQSFVCSCKLGFTPSADYTQCLTEIDVGGECYPGELDKGVCRGSMRLAGAVSTCSEKTKLCECVAPFSNNLMFQYSDIPGYCRIAFGGNGFTYGRIYDRCDDNRPCYPSTSTECREGRCYCKAGFRQKLPLEYGYLPDRKSPCIAEAFSLGMFIFIYRFHHWQIHLRNL